MSNLTHLALGFEKLLSRLPGAIRKPVEREWRPIHELFLQRRPPRLLVIGTTATVEPWLRALFQMDQGKATFGTGPWRIYQHRGTMEFAFAETEAAIQDAMASATPDFFLYVGDKPPGNLSMRHPGIAAVLGETSRETLLSSISQELPLDTRLEFARVSGEKSAQREIAKMITRSATAVCTAVGTQPIPLADFPILTSLQVLMVSGIIQTTGREWNVRLARDFLAALGANIGLGVLFREGARAAVKLLPGWGNAISGAVAGAGTYAIGRAASAFFIEGLPIEDARKRFHFFKKQKPPPQLRG